MTGSTPGGVPEYPDDAADQPSDADCAGRLQRAALLRMMGQPDRAVEEAGRLCVDFPDSPQAHLELALSLLEAERVDEARREAHEALALDPGNVWATFLSAELTPSFSLFKRRSLMRRVVELDPDSGVALARLALLERHCGAGRRRCRKLAERALDAEPYNPSVYVAVAELELSLDNVRRARARVSEALSLSPDHAGALALQAKLANSTKQIREARTALSSALAVDPTDSRLASGVHELGHHGGLRHDGQVGQVLGVVLARRRGPRTGGQVRSRAVEQLGAQLGGAGVLDVDARAALELGHGGLEALGLGAGQAAGDGDGGALVALVGLVGGAASGRRRAGPAG